jgi:hypothetical protein
MGKEWRYASDGEFIYQYYPPRDYLYETTGRLRRVCRVLKPPTALTDHYQDRKRKREAENE